MAQHVVDSTDVTPNGMEEVIGSIPIRSTNQINHLAPSPLTRPLSHPCRKFEDLSSGDSGPLGPEDTTGANSVVFIVASRPGFRFFFAGFDLSISVPSDAWRSLFLLDFNSA
jgi:hypothetical protein